MLVKAEPGKSPDYLVKRFMRKFKKSGILKELLDRRTFKKPTKIRREKELKRRLVLKRLREEQQAGTI